MKILPNLLAVDSCGANVTLHCGKCDLRRYLQSLAVYMTVSTTVFTYHVTRLMPHPPIYTNSGMDHFHRK